jgi:drug/metabolite transporter (DMT)-like permease
MPPRSPQNSLTDVAVFSAPGVFLVLWSSGFIGSKLGMPYAEPMTFLTIRMAAVVVLLGALVLITRPIWPDRADVWHSATIGLLVHGCYLGGVFVAIAQQMPAGLVALIVALQPVLTSTLANRLFGERVTARQWLGLALGIVAFILRSTRDRRRGNVRRMDRRDRFFARHHRRYALPEALWRRD